MSLQFKDNQCVKIENQKELDKVKQFLRNPNRDIKIDVFPIYLENTESVTRGRSIGYIMNPIGTWSRKPLEVLTLKDFEATSV